MPLEKVLTGHSLAKEVVSLAAELRPRVGRLTTLRLLVVKADDQLNDQLVPNCFSAPLAKGIYLTQAGIAQIRTYKLFRRLPRVLTDEGICQLGDEVNQQIRAELVQLRLGMVRTFAM